MELPAQEGDRIYMAAGLSWNVFAAAAPAAGNAQNASEGKGDIPTYRQDARHDQGYEEEN